MPDTTDAIPRTTELIQQQMSEGLHVGAQLYVSLEGKPVANLALGLARPGVPMRPFTLMLWLSSTKPIAAVAIGQLWEKGKLGLDDLVAKHIPEFAQNGKGQISIRHVLTHTGGFRGLVGRWEDQPWEQVIDAVCKTKLEPGWVPGRKAGYHLHTSWYILGELIRRLDGRSFEQYVREQLFLPLGMANCWIGGLTGSTAKAYGDRLGLMHDTSVEGVGPKVGHPLDDPDALMRPRPGSNGRGPVRELGRFYEAMLFGGKLEGTRILMPETVEAMTAAHRVGLYDHTFRHTIDWGLGFIRNSAHYDAAAGVADTTPYGYGSHASPRTFGHSGSQSSVGMCDPENGLVVALVFNGMAGEQRHDRRVRAVLGTLYEELRLA
jgi:CubicO group peptidase (beta-lactamase class C family)